MKGSGPIVSPWSTLTRMSNSSVSSSGVYTLALVSVYILSISLRYLGSPIGYICPFQAMYWHLWNIMSRSVLAWLVITWYPTYLSRFLLVWLCFGPYRTSYLAWSGKVSTHISHFCPSLASYQTLPSTPVRISTNLARFWPLPEISVHIFLDLGRYWPLLDKIKLN